MIIYFRKVGRAGDSSTSGDVRGCHGTRTVVTNADGRVTCRLRPSRSPCPYKEDSLGLLVTPSSRLSPGDSLSTSVPYFIWDICGSVFPSPTLPFLRATPPSTFGTSSSARTPWDGT